MKTKTMKELIAAALRWTGIAGVTVGTSMPVTLAAGRISEPDTILYGRIVQRVGTKEFQIASGQLVWTLKTSGPAGREYQVRATVQPTGDGRFSYRLRIPHQVKAYDLSVADDKVALGAAPASVQHVSVTLDGKPLSVQAMAIDGFSLSQSSRAGVRRVDLEMVAEGADTDGDGLPDWWEDANGYDKWDPADGTDRVSGGGTGGGTNTVPTAANARTFAEWRTAWFPADSRALDVFGQDDADRDGVANLYEYAFGLDPLVAEATGVASLPRTFRQGDRVGVRFTPRANATDLSFRVEVSEDLFAWRDAAAEMESVALDGAAGEQAWVEKTPSTAEQRYLRVRIERH